MEAFQKNLQASATDAFLSNFRIFQKSYSKRDPGIAASVLSPWQSSFDLLSYIII